MNMDSKGKGRFFSSFKYAFHGVCQAIVKERNFQFHVMFSIIVIFISFLFNINRIEWLFVIISIFGVFALELVNTAIERTVDLITSEIHPLAKQAKDVAAAAVLIYAIMTVIIGCIIFFPKFAHLILRYIS